MHFAPGLIHVHVPSHHEPLKLGLIVLFSGGFKTKEKASHSTLHTCVLTLRKVLEAKTIPLACHQTEPAEINRAYGSDSSA